MPDVTFRISAPDRSIDASVHLPDEALRPDELMPIALGMTSALVQMHAAHDEEQGHTVSCKAGCGACCRQLVAISEPEALHLVDAVGRMDPERREVILKRFAEARERSAEVLQPVRETRGMNVVDALLDAGRPYFELGIPCPFLENESCGIYEHRPAKCREYLVTSPAEYCGKLDFTQIRGVQIPKPVSSGLLYFSDGKGTETPRVLLMLDIFEWAVRLEQRPKAQASVELFSNLLKVVFHRVPKDPDGAQEGA